MGLGLEPLLQSYEEVSPLDTPGWDSMISGYSTKYLFHEACWLRFLERSQGVKIRGIRLLDREERTLGYFCAGEVRKGPFRLLGSPLQGWTTNFMGPVVNEVDAQSLLTAIDRYCRGHGVDYVELCNPALPPSAMRASGYELDPDSTFLVTIDNETEMWRRLSESCRYSVRRAMRNGLRVERTTDPAFIQQYYAQVKDVFLRQRLVPTYGPERVQFLWDSLMPAGRLLALRVWYRNEVVGSGLFPFDDRMIYFWGGASWVRAYPLHPNELLQWNVMLFALESGIPLYNMGGGGYFKEKFGGRKVAVERWFKPLSPLARAGRTAFKHYVRSRQRILGYVRQSFSARGEPGIAERADE